MIFVGIVRMDFYIFLILASFQLCSIQYLIVLKVQADKIWFFQNPIITNGPVSEKKNLHFVKVYKILSVGVAGCAFYFSFSVRDWGSDRFQWPKKTNSQIKFKRLAFYKCVHCARRKIT